MSKPLTFNARVQKAKKVHKCWACLRDIPIGEPYTVYPGKNSADEFQSTKICYECGYLMTQKTGVHARNIRQGEFTERLLPNCLRKIRAEFRKEPLKLLEELDARIATFAPVEPKPCEQIVVKRSQFDCKVFHLPESRYKVAQFPKGQQLTIRAGVSGQSRTATIKGVWSTDGSAFGCNKRQVAVLVA